MAGILVSARTSRIELMRTKPSSAFYRIRVPGPSSVPFPRLNRSSWFIAPLRWCNKGQARGSRIPVVQGVEVIFKPGVQKFLALIGMADFVGNDVQISVCTFTVSYRCSSDRRLVKRELTWFKPPESDAARYWQYIQDQRNFRRLRRTFTVWTCSGRRINLRFRPSYPGPTVMSRLQ